MNIGVIAKCMQDAVKAGVFPSGVLLFAVGDKLFDPITAGDAKADTIYDLASLTKPLVMVALCMKLVERGELRLNEQWKMWLGHTSGLPAWAPYFLSLQKLPKDQRKQALQQMLLNEPLENTAAKVAVYSDLGYMRLTYEVEKLTGQPFNDLVQNLVFKPLGVNLVFWGEGTIDKPNVAATGALAVSGEPIRVGEVNDDNALAASFPLGHAGLFGNAANVMAMVQWLSTQVVGGWGRLGFDTPTGDNPAAGKLFSPQSFGHLGFTGTSFWVDPIRALTVVLLTNRVALGNENFKIKEFRPVIHTLIANFVGDLC